MLGQPTDPSGVRGRNELFKADDFRAAIEQYTAALEVFGLVHDKAAEAPPRAILVRFGSYC